jgi:hypothetical protein
MEYLKERKVVSSFQNVMVQYQRNKMKCDCDPFKIHFNYSLIKI